MLKQLSPPGVELQMHPQGRDCARPDPLFSKLKVSQHFQPQILGGFLK